MTLGLEKNDVSKCVQILTQYLGNTFGLYLKTHTFHWNVTGPNFYSLHKLFGEQYETLFDSIDEIAERIRSLGSFVDMNFQKIQTLSHVKDAPVPSHEKEMISSLLEDHEKTIAFLRKGIHELSEMNDVVSEDFLISRLAEHEKIVWILKSHCG